MIEPDRSGGYIALFSEIGFTLFLMTLGGAGLGIWADGQLGTKPWLSLLGFLGGAGIGGYGVFVILTRFLARLDERERRPPKGG